LESEALTSPNSPVAKITNAITRRRHHVLLASLLLILRRPDALLHPLFWGEDGKIFFHDAYTIGLPALFMPYGGYFSTSSRIMAALAAPLPLVYAPVIFAALAFLVQILPIILLLSPRLDAALPSWPARLALVYFYVLEPNAYELNVNLTNTQWHLAEVAFLLLLASPATTRLARIGELALLALSGLSGPFDIFLTPLAWLDVWRQRSRRTSLNALVLSASSAVQLSSVILLSHTARSSGPLFASPLLFAKIMANQLFFGGLLGFRWMHRLFKLGADFDVPFAVIITLLGVILFAVALAIGNTALRRGAFWTLCMLAAALLSPYECNWTQLAVPGNATRYFLMPILVWFGALLTLSVSPRRSLRVCSRVLLGVSVVGALVQFQLPFYQTQGFYSQAQTFDQAPAGTDFAFAEDPSGWIMTLRKN
jgi:hypothetical protein